MRAEREAHKRLMLLATISGLAALTRFPLGAARIPFAFAALAGLLLAGPIFDWKTRGRVHVTYIWGGLLTVVSGVLRPVIGNTLAWHHLARWLLGW